jgi:hypothetical protein
MFRLAPEAILTGTTWSIAVLWMFMKIALNHVMDASPPPVIDSPGPLKEAA